MTATPAVLLDSFSDLDFVEAADLGIDLLIHPVEFGGENWLDMHGLAYTELFRRLGEGAAFPKLAPMSVSAYRGTLERILSRAPYVVVIHASAYLSPAIAVARAAAHDFPGRVGVVDGRTVSAGLSLQADWAARQARAGFSGPEIVAGLEALIERQRTMLTLPTLRYLHTPDSQVWRENMGVDTAVVVSHPGGHPKVVGAPQDPLVRFRVMRQYLQRYANELPRSEVAFFHADAPEAVQQLAADALRLGLQVRWTTCVGPLYSAQLGWGAYGFSILPSDPL